MAMDFAMFKIAKNAKKLWEHLTSGGIVFVWLQLFVMFF